MKKGYIPRDQRKTILFLADDIRLHSGVGCQAREIVMNSAHHFNWINIGAAIKHPEAGQAFDLSGDINNMLGINDSSVKVIPCDGYGSPDMIRGVIHQEKPDAIIHFTDPRYWTWLYAMENEIRQNIPMVFYTIWDDVPYPYYNRTFYRSDDMLLCISKQTKNIVENVLKGYEKPDWAVKYVPHGIDSKKFFPILNDFEYQAYKEEILGEEEQDFVVFWNSRNIRRKNTADLIIAWKVFLDQLPAEKAEKCTLILKTDPVDEHGTDLPAVIETVLGKKSPRVKIVGGRLPEKQLNYLYNMSDTHMFFTDNEGWGLGLTESLMAGRMIIAPVQGGMQDQMRFEDENGDWINFSTEHPSNVDGKYKKCGEWAMPMFPKTRSSKGSPITPYIFASQCSIEDGAIALMKVYKLGKEERIKRGLAGREWAMSDEAGFTGETMGERFIENLNVLFDKWTPRERFDLEKVTPNSISPKTQPTPISLTPEFLKEIQSI
jgi:glycosyltransferase involved in cell wall biosynthesis